MGSYRDGCACGWWRCLVLGYKTASRIRDAACAEFVLPNLIMGNQMTDPAKSISIFFLLTFVWSWSCWLLAPVVQAESNYASSALFFLGGFGPSLAAIAVVCLYGGRTGLRTWLLRCLTWRGSSGWLVLAFLSPPAGLAVAAGAHMPLGSSVPPSPAIAHVGLFVANIFLIFLVGAPLVEELGWRSASLALGIILGLLHLPLFYVADSTQNNGSMAAFFVLIVATSVFYTWLYNRNNGSVLPALTLHTASNSWPFLVPVLPSNTEQRPYLFVVALVVTTAIWLLIRRDDRFPHKGRPS